MGIFGQCREVLDDRNQNAGSDVLGDNFCYTTVCGAGNLYCRDVAGQKDEESIQCDVYFGSHHNPASVCRKFCFCKMDSFFAGTD